MRFYYSSVELVLMLYYSVISRKYWLRCQTAPTRYDRCYNGFVGICKMFVRLSVDSKTEIVESDKVYNNLFDR